MPFTTKELIKVSMENETDFLRKVEGIFDRMMKRAKEGNRSLKVSFSTEWKTIDGTGEWENDVTEEATSIMQYIKAVDNEYNVSLSYNEKTMIREVFLSITW